MDARKLATGLLTLVFLAGSLTAQEVSPTDATADQTAAAPAFGLGLGVGTQLIDGETYQSVSFIPDLAIGPFGVGLDVKLNYQFYRWQGDELGFYVRARDWMIDENNDARPDPWDSHSLQKYLDMYLSKIVYLRYGTKGDPLYAKIGLFEDGTLGNGFIMSGYSNALLRPEYSYVGLALDVDGALFGFPLVGIETFTNSVTGFDIIGGRAYVRPLKPLNIPVFGDLQIGVTGVMDRDPYAMYRKIYNPELITNAAERAAAIAAMQTELDTYADNEVLVWGVDARQPLVHLGSFFNLSTFGDIVMQGTTAGGMVGLGGNLLFLSFNGQYRRLGPNFQPVYFDSGYDLSRVSKLKTYLLNTDGNFDESTLVSTPTVNSWFFQAGTSFFDSQIAFKASLEGPAGSNQDIDRDSALAWPKIRSSLVVDGTKILPVPLTFTGFYDKDFIRDVGDLISPEDALIGAKLGYQLGAATIQLTYNVEYIPEEQQVPGEDTWKVTSKLETVITLK